MSRAATQSLRRSHPARGFATGALLAVVGVSANAEAQDASTSSLGITVNPTVARFASNGTTPYPFRAANLNPGAINFKDCADNIVLEFELTETGLSTTDTLQVWAGPTDCTQESARVSGTSGPFCWRVAPDAAYGVSVSVPVYARNVTQFLDDTSSDVLAYTPRPGTTPGAAACQTQQAPGPVGLTVYFMFVNGNATDVDAVASYPIDVDMVGPLAPLDLTAGIGDTLLLLTWTPQTDSTIQGFNIYVEDQGATGADGSTEAGGSSPTDCTSNVLVDTFTTTVTAGGGSSDGGTVVVGVPDGGVSGSEAVGISEIDAGYLAGSLAGGTSTKYTLSTLPDGRPLVDGHQYAVAVAAFDDTGNVGLVSNLACQAPAPVVDFFNAYGSAGGAAGGGFCSLQAPGAPAFGSALGTVLGVAAVAFVRRRRRRR